MTTIIKDGTGRGYKAKIDSDFRLYTNALTLDTQLSASFNEKAYNINTGIINLNSSSKSAVLYLKNNETLDLVITGLFYLIGNSSGGNGDMLISVLRNPKSGTIISSASAVEINANRHFGSENELEIDVYKGAEGSTFTDGTKLLESIINQSPSRIPISTGGFILPRGASIGIELTPASGNTSLNVEIAIAAHL